MKSRDEEKSRDLCALFNLRATMINCAFLNACCSAPNTPFWVKFDPSSVHEG